MKLSVKLIPAFLTVARAQNNGPCSRTYHEMPWGTSDMKVHLSGGMIHEVQQSTVESMCASDPACIGYTKSWNLAKHEKTPNFNEK